MIILARYSNLSSVINYLEVSIAWGYAFA